jgi:CubicO group peptidase (beta-lactamase class C family)
LDEYFEKMVKDWDVPSASIGVVKDGQLVFTGNYGVKEIGMNEAPDKNTLYAIASNTKAFTTSMIGMLVEEGVLNWDDKVKKYIPYFELYDPWVSNEVTVRDLLCHRVGLGTFNGDVIWYKSNFTAEEIIKRYKHLPKAYDFRAGYGYSNLMYVTAGLLIEKVTGKTWSQNVQERIFDPLGMNRSITTPNMLESKGNFATPHARENEENIPIGWEDWEAVAATGGIISSVEDVSKWMIFNLNKGIWDGDTLLSKSTINTLWKPHNNFTVDHTKENDFGMHFRAYGLGWGLRDHHGNLRVSHTGGYDGMITAVTLIPDENLGVVVLTNGMKSPIMAATYYAIDRFLDQEVIDWSAKHLEFVNNRREGDTRIQDRKASRVMDTKPSLSLDKYAGVYMSDIYGKITISKNDDGLVLDFERSPALSAKLIHWHYDVWEIKWDEPHAWFSFGTLKFNMDNNLKITGMDFDVPNNDIFFEELKPYRVD